MDYAYVETEPTEPDQEGADEDHGNVVRLGVSLFAQLSLSQNQGIGQGRATTGDVDGSTTGIIERGEVGKPSISVPCPAGNGAVDDGGPPETEEQDGDDATTLKGTTNDDHDGDDAEEALVEAEENFWKETNGGRCDINETEVFHVTDEGTGGWGVGEGVAPEHPLEGDDLMDHVRGWTEGSAVAEELLTPMTAKPWYNMDRADLRRARPPYNKARPGMIIQTK